MQPDRTAGRTIKDAEAQMGFGYRKLTEADLGIFIRMRIAQLREEGAEEDTDLRPA